jgi:protease PrsW
LFYLIAITGAIVPALALLWFFQKRDLFREPPKMVWATFGLGILTIFPVLAIGLPLEFFLIKTSEWKEPLAIGAYNSFVMAALLEECSKFLVIYFFAARSRHFDEPMDGMVYGAAASLGFAALENIMYCSTGDYTTVISRAFTSVPVHACLGAMMGYFIGQAKFNRKKKPGFQMFNALYWPILLHGLYDLPLLTVATATELYDKPTDVQLALLPITFATLIFLAIWVLVIGARLRRQQKELAPKIPIGIVVPPPTKSVPYAVPVAAPPAEAPEKKRSFWKGFAVVIGILLMIAGTGITLLALFGVIIDDDRDYEISHLILGLIFVGVIPALFGGLLTWFGLRKSRA